MLVIQPFQNQTVILRGISEGCLLKGRRQRSI